MQYTVWTSHTEEIIRREESSFSFMANVAV